VAHRERVGDAKPAGERIGEATLPSVNGHQFVATDLAKALQPKVGASGESMPPLILLFDRLLKVPTMTQEAGRRLVMDQLRPEMADAVAYFPQTRLHLLSLLRTAMNYPGGVEELLTAVRLVEGNSTPIRLLDETVEELLAGRPD
jgi:hypothetical protein